MANDAVFNAVDLREQNLNGLIAEDVMSKLWDISNVPLPFTSMIGSGSHDNMYSEWTIDKLKPQDFDNIGADGMDAKGENDLEVGQRVGNHSQIATKEVDVSHRGQQVDTIGFANALAKGIMKAQKHLKRDVEGMLMMNRGSVKSEQGTDGQTAGLGAWLTTTDVKGVADATNNVIGADVAGGWFATPTDSLVASHTPRTAAALTETNVRDVVESVYLQGGEVDTMMMRPELKRKFSEYLLSDAARIATLLADGGGAASERKASGSVDVFLSDYGTLKMVPNRLQPGCNAANGADYSQQAAFFLDSSLLEVSYLQGYRTDALAKTGLSDKRMMSVDFMLKCFNWDGLGMITGIDPTADVTFA